MLVSFSLLLAVPLSKQLSDAAMPAEGHALPHAVPRLQPEEEPGHAAAAPPAEVGAVRNGEQLESMSENVLSKTDCPKHLRGVLFNHIPKTGT